MVDVGVVGLAGVLLVLGFCSCDMVDGWEMCGWVGNEERRVREWESKGWRGEETRAWWLFDLD